VEAMKREENTTIEVLALLDEEAMLEKPIRPG
jgi:hypothetical protein